MRVLPLVLALLVARSAYAAPGDVLQRYTLDLSGSACAFSGEPHTPVGILVKGTRLYVSCWSDTTISTFNVKTGARIGAPKSISGLTRLGALTFDKLTKQIYACGDGGWVGIIDLTAQHFTPVFAAACVDGLLWDATDDTFWAGGDDAPTIEHYMADGTLISTTDIHAMIGGCGRTGIEAVGGKLFIGNPSCGIYTMTRALASASLFVTPSPLFVEDMACDSATFGKTLNKTALWVVHPYDTEVVAYEAPPKGSNRPPCK